MAQMLLDLVYSLGNCLNCFPGSPTLKINSRSFKILRLLGEGGFSYVYLVQDTSTAELFALKKIRCPFGQESVQQAMREVEAYKTFAHVSGIIHAVDYSVAQDRSDADAKMLADAIARRALYGSFKPPLEGDECDMAEISVDDAMRRISLSGVY